MLYAQNYARIPRVEDPARERDREIRREPTNEWSLYLVVRLKIIIF